MQVGDILQIAQDECFPADLLVLGSNLEGVCYIETGALDGEKNLKPRAALVDTADFFATGQADIVQMATKDIFMNDSTAFELNVHAKPPD